MDKESPQEVALLVTNYRKVSKLSDYGTPLSAVAKALLTQALRDLTVTLKSS
jgi:hypothetical protein